MKNLKKLISVIIAVIMIVGSFATVAAVDYADVESTNSYAKAIQVLSGLGIAKGDTEGNFNPTADVKRSEMVTFICRALDEEDIAAGAASADFTDVAADHWAAGYIAWGVNRGIINGMGDGTFAPDAPVKYQDAVVMIMRALGYDGLASRPVNGGYPTGYLKLASKYGVLTNAGYSATKEATREIIAQLIYNAIEAPVVEVSEYGSEATGDKYVVCDGTLDTTFKSILTMREITKVKAYVKKTALADDKLITDEGVQAVVEIDKVEKTLYVGETNLTNMTAETVELYYAEDEELNDAEVALAVVVSNATVSKEIANVTKVEKKKVGEEYVLVVTYKENADDSARNAKEIDVKVGANIYLNNAANGTADVEGEEDKALLNLLKGAATIKLTKEKSASTYGTIFVEQYTAYKVVEEVLVEKERILFADDTSLKLDPEDREYEKFTYELYDANGAVIGLEDIKEGDVLNILTPAGKKISGKGDDVAKSMIIYVSSNTVEGSVDEKVDADTYVIAGEEYDICDGVSVNVGEAGKYFITIDGKVCYEDASSAISTNYAFVSFASYKSSGLSSAAVKVDLLTKDGAIETFTLAKEVKYDGKAAEKAADVRKKLAAMTTKKAATDRAITYKLDSDGNIKEIVTYANLKKVSNITAGSKSAKWDADVAEFGKYDAEDAKLLIINQDDAVYVKEEGTTATVKVEEEDKELQVYSIDEDCVTLASFADLVHDDTYTVTAFQTAKEVEDDVITFAVSTTKIADSYINATMAVVAKVVEAYANDTEVTKVTLIQDGEAKDLVLSSKVKFVNVDGGKTYDASNIAAGAVIQYQVDADGEINDVQFIAEKDMALTDVAKGFVAEDNKYAFGAGYIAKKVSGKLYFSATLEAEKDTDKAKFAEELAALKVLDGAYTYAKVDLYALANEEKGAIEAIDYLDIEAATDAYEVVYAIYKVDEDGDVQDIVVFEDTENGLFAK